MDKLQSVTAEIYTHHTFQKSASFKIEFLFTSFSLCVCCRRVAHV